MENKSVMIKELPLMERPYERCLLHGPSILTDVELLAVIIRTGVRGESSLTLAQRILSLNDSQGILGLLHLSIPQLKKLNGVGDVKAVQLQCIGELSKRIWKTVAADSIALATPEAIAGYYMEDMRHMEQEHLMLLMFNTKNVLIKDMVLYKGTVNASIISPREIFIEAFRYHAVYIILLHNHPSGDPTPSYEDIRLTKQIKEAGCIMGIKLIDHIIIGDNSYNSLKERGILNL